LNWTEATLRLLLRLPWMLLLPVTLLLLLRMLLLPVTLRLL
jgi:hypothetical protein